MLEFERKECYNVEDFKKIISILRSENGCPWDREQTHESIRRNLLEEAYEVCEAIDEGSVDHLREELGDLLMQVIFHSQIETEIGNFNLDDVADTACKKLILRHPHVFSGLEVADTSEVLTNWDEIKRAEKSQKTTADAMKSVAKSLPGLWRAEKLQSKAAKVGFDWNDIDEALLKLREETDELYDAVASGDSERIFDEIGDVLFAAVTMSRFAKIDPETAIANTCEKFISRFEFTENLATAKGKKMEDCSVEELIELYNLSKIKEKSI